MFKRLLFTGCFLYISFGLWAQECNLSLEGRVRDRDNSEELGFAYIKLVQLEKTIQCDEAGKFRFDGLCAGTYQLLVQHLGCIDSLFTVEVRSSRKIVLRMPHLHNQLQAVEIISQHQDMLPTQNHQVLDAKALDRSRGLPLGEQLKQLNGVNTFNSGPSIVKPMLNGMQGYRILILNNGVRLEGQQWGSDHAPEIDPYLAEQISVVRGAAAVRYGSDAIGGVILIEPPALPDTPSVSGEWSSALFSNGRGAASALRLQGNFEKLKAFSWQLQGSLRRSGDMKTPEYYLKNTGLSEANFSYRLKYHTKRVGFDLYYSQFNSRVGIFSNAHVGNLSDLQAAFNRNKPLDSLAEFSYTINRAYQQLGHEIIKASADLHTGLRSRVYLNYAIQFNVREEYDKDQAKNDSIAALNLPQAEYRLSTQSAEIIWEHDYIKGFRGKYGIQGMLQENRCFQRWFIPNYNAQNIGLFALERRIWPRLEAEAGLRYDLRFLQSYYYKNNQLQEPKRQFENLSINSGILYKPFRSLQIRLNLSSGWRAPSVNELYSDGLHHGIGAIERGDPDLQHEQCYSVIGGLSYSRKHTRIEWNAYYYDFENFIYYQPSGKAELTIRGAFPVFLYKQNDARISGTDLRFEQDLLPFLSFSFSGAMVRGYNTELDQHLLYMPADRFQIALAYKPRNREHFKDVFIEPQFQYVAEQTRTQAGVDYAEPPEAYALFGIQVGSCFLLGRQPIYLNLSVNNMMNSIYRDYLDRFRYYNDALGSNYTIRIRLPLNIYKPKNQTK